MGKEREKRGEREGKEKGIRGKIGVKCKILKKRVERGGKEDIWGYLGLSGLSGAIWGYLGLSGLLRGGGANPPQLA